VLEIVASEPETRVVDQIVLNMTDLSTEKDASGMCTSIAMTQAQNSRPIAPFGLVSCLL